MTTPIRSFASRRITIALVVLATAGVEAKPVAFGFAPMAEYPAGFAPQEIATGDFNNDGNADVVVAGEFPFPSFAPAEDEIRVLLGDGAGGLRAIDVGHAAGFSVSAIAVSDFDDDGNLDVVAANDLAVGTVHVLYGRGNASFDPALRFYAGANPTDVASGDLNGDGRPDIVTADAAPWSGEFTDEASTPGAAVLYATAPRGFLTAQKIATDAPVRYARIGPFDGDARADVGLAGPVAAAPAVLPGYSKVFVARRTPGGGFVLQAPTEFTGRVVALEAGHLMRRGWLDLVAAADIGASMPGLESEVIAFLNTGQGVFLEPRRLRATQPVVTDVAVGYVDSDTWPEVIALGHNPLVLAPFDVGSISVYRNRLGGFAEAADFPTTPRSGLQLTTGRFSSDRATDVAVSLPNARAVGMFVNQTPAIYPFLEPLTLQARAGVPLGWVPIARFIVNGPPNEPRDFSATVSWGDRSSPTPGIVVVSALAGYFVLGNHTYARPDTYLVTVRVTWPATGAVRVLYALAVVE